MGAGYTRGGSDVTFRSPYPLTITDFASRYLLTCEALSTTQEKFAFTVFERTFKEFGLPGAIRTDNGVPFASAHALYGLSKLAVWWLRLGIEIERIKPGHPEQNGRHERMHLTLKKDATKPAAPNVFQQQARFDAFVEQYNRDRPHQGLGMQVPAAVYARSARVYRGLEELTYPFHDATFTVTQCGRICFKARKVNLSHVFAGQNVGVTQVSERVWLVTFMRYDLGYFDDETCGSNDRESVHPESVTYVLGMNCYLCPERTTVNWRARQTRTCDPGLEVPRGGNQGQHNAAAPDFIGVRSSPRLPETTASRYALSVICQSTFASRRRRPHRVRQRESSEHAVTRSRRASHLVPAR